MSTRRARVKAVISLPPRRKNNEAANKANELVKEAAEKPIKSPRTPRGSLKSQDSIDRQSPKPGSPLRSPRSGNVLRQQERVPSPLVQAEVTKEAALTPKKAAKVSVITSVNSAKSSVFVSPKRVASPFRKLTPSPLVHTSVSVQRVTPLTPEKVARIYKLDGSKIVESETSSRRKRGSKDASTSNVASDVPDDYNVPSVPESITEDTVMDGIVPLQSLSSSGPKPLALLKNEIISENVEVSFDPIVPLPSPSKVRQKLRPVPRLAPLRRNSVQGSASESEDESRRALLSSGGTSTPAPPSRQRERSETHTPQPVLPTPNKEINRIRQDSMCSSVSQLTTATQPPTATSPTKEKQVSKTRRLDMSRRMAAMRRRREAVKKDTLTMYDLIFYNPTTNPIVPDDDEIEAKKLNEKEEAARNAKQAEDKEDDEPEQDAAPVPQIKLGPNGEIMLDEQSLVIKQSQKRKVSQNVVHEGAWATGSSSGRYRRTPRTADWSDAETVRFYRALAAMGTDFMLMERLFPGRTRRDLKLKFKKEERMNMAQVDKALRTTVKWDASRLEDEFQAERKEAEIRAARDKAELNKRTKENQQRRREARDLKIKMSHSTKALESSIFPDTSVTLTADQVILRYHEAKEKAKETKGKRGRPRMDSPSKHAISQETPRVNVTPSQPHLDMATLTKIDPKSMGKTPDKQPTPSPVVPSNIENGSLVVLTVNDPKSPAKKMLQTYIASGGGRLTPVALPNSLLNSVVTFMKKGGTPKSMSAASSPHLTSPSSVTSQDSRPSSTPGVIVNASPAKRQRHSSYTITQL
ncbi:transcription factor TFIIIB component B'' [Spodoptera litura]|uniref:Transcription factor TFIIIB component B'' n=1 Tax=Spodoptera litura TaxID=69820 RepID=A0A9J7ED92_SPOLT|nr:transcription factor TFIIIB component B'' [Spodoptera litura]